MKTLTLRRLKNTDFKCKYFELISGVELDNSSLITVMSLAIAFINFNDELINELGYRMILFYSKLYRDYKPLYEVSQSKGLIPISKFIDETLQYGEKYRNIQTEINDILSYEYFIDGSFRTAEQKNIVNFAIKNEKSSMVIVAPTSYGKTELIIDAVERSEEENICIITPSKALLAQTKRRLINTLGNIKIITQPEMYDDSKDKRIVAVFTQERLMRFLKENSNIRFDKLIIDEAHNLLDKINSNSNRSVLLASSIILCRMRNENLKCTYLTPFLKSTNNLQVNFNEDRIVEYIVTEKVKTELFYFHDIAKGTVEIYDQYLDDFIHAHGLTKSSNDVDVVIQNSNMKNIIYLNKPKDLELFASELSKRSLITDSKIIKKAVEDIKEYIHKDYKLASLLENGVIYHHGSVPEAVRYHIEDLYESEPDLHYLVANSTLLEGVNLPATKMFILNPMRGRSIFRHSTFKNLIGRVCRFNEIFDTETGNLDYLIPEIHIVKGAFYPESYTKEGFFSATKSSVSKKVVDINENPLLRNGKSSEDLAKEATEFVKNLVDSKELELENVRVSRTSFGKSCFKNNIRSFDIIDKEIELNKKIEEIENNITDLNHLFEYLNYIFFVNIDSEASDNLSRLRHVEARSFYKMIISWRMKGDTISDMVEKVILHWNSLDQNELVYVGRWGDQRRDGFRELWIKLSEKSYTERVNLAIVRLKEEFDFIDNEIMKYVEVFNEHNIVNQDLYLKIRYGTSNKDKIDLLNYGISSQLSELLSSKYQDDFTIESNNNITFSKELLPKMRVNGENGILVTEVKFNSKNN